MAEIRVGTSGWLYPPWRGTFYPPGLAHRRELEYLSRHLATAEINGSFYALQRPERYRHWFAETPEDFVFSVKGGRFITHMKQLREIQAPLANFFASGVLALSHKLGPILWQLPPRMRYDAERLAGFFDLLPRTTRQAAALARRHDDKLKGDAHTKPGTNRPIRHALEVRHPSFVTADTVQLLREHDVGLVVSDSAGDWPCLEDVTSDFVYIRMHGDQELYASGYGEQTLRGWAAKIADWRSGKSPRTAHTLTTAAPRKRRDVYVYFDNDIKAHAPADAARLAELLGVGPKGAPS